MAGNPDSPHWWMQPINLEELKTLIATVQRVHGSGKHFAGITMNRIEIALQELQERMENDSR